MAPTQQQAKQARAKVLSTGKQPKASIQRYLKSTEAQLVEKEAKSVLLLRGIRCSDAMTTVLRDMRSMNAPNAKLLNKNNQIVPFDDEGQLSLEFLTTKNDCSLFAIASSNKKRPNNLVMGRTFDHQVLDMVELGILRYKSMNDYAGMPKKRVGSKPMMLFVGDAWHLDTECKKLQNLLLDFYRGDPVEKLVLSGLDHAMVFTAVADAPPLQQPGLDNATTLLIHQRTYYCKLKKNTTGGSGSAPLPYLTPSGPDMDFRVRIICIMCYLLIVLGTVIISLLSCHLFSYFGFMFLHGVPHQQLCVLNFHSFVVSFHPLIYVHVYPFKTVIHAIHETNT
uniref:Ribosome production factor 2 homolog n=1 Tax=Ditylum brightwellii TaxID=49249 RepID=A0A7S4T360_9STRA